MHVAILGGAGFLGSRLAARLAASGCIGNNPIDRLVLFDATQPHAPASARMPVDCVQGDVSTLAADAFSEETGLIFHLAAVVSAQAEADYDLGLRVNLHGALAVAQACRHLAHKRGQPPRLVFTSSVASFSGGQDACLDDDARQLPANSYGAEKAAAELLLADASRRTFLDLVSLRLPTIVVRPGRPNRAASSFFSAIIREPLLGLSTTLPVPPDFRAWVASPRQAIAWLLHAGAMATHEMGLDRSVNPPGLSVSVAEMLRALEEVRPGAAHLVQSAPDREIAQIVSTWPASFNPVRGAGLGFGIHEPFVEVVRAFVEDDLAATRADRAGAS